MHTLIENVTLFFGRDFQVVRKGWIEIDHGAITYAGEDKPHFSSQDTRVLNGDGLLAIPGLIDAHTHIGDSIAKDMGVGLGLNQLVHPIHGLKTRLLNEAQEGQVRHAMNEITCDMLASGITTFVDFREGGLNGVVLALKSIYDPRQRAMILGRPNYNFQEDEVAKESQGLPSTVLDELERALDICSGVGLSGPNEYTGEAMKQISEIAKSKRKLVAVHAAESLESKRFSLEHFSAAEVDRALRYMKPDFMVHLANSTAEERQKVSERQIPVVCSPRANAILGLGLPPILDLLERGVTVALGTDNVMLNAPDMFREMDYTSRAIRAFKREPGAISCNDILKMATISAADALGLGSMIGSIEEGKRADIAFLDLNSPNLHFSRDLVASTVHRARACDVRCVMVDGDILHGSIPRA